MMNANEIASAWKEVVKIYNNTSEQTPKVIMNEIVAKFGKRQTEELFATIAAIKKHDGRIYGKNREYMNSIPIDISLTVWGIENPIVYAGLDDIHTAHVDQLITELRQMEE